MTFSKLGANKMAAFFCKMAASLSLKCHISRTVALTNVILVSNTRFTGSVSSIKLVVILSDDGLPSVRLSICMSVRRHVSFPCDNLSTVCPIFTIFFLIDINHGKTPIEREVGRLKAKVTRAKNILFSRTFVSVLTR